MNREQEKYGPLVRKLVIWTVVIVVAIILASIASCSSCHTVPPGNVGVQVWMGSVQNEVLAEGFHWVQPGMSVEDMSTQTQNITFAGDTAITPLSADQLSMSVNASVLFHLDGRSAPGIYRLMPDYPDSVIAPSIRVAARDAFREFTAVEAVTTKRMVVGELMSKLLVQRVSHAMKQRRLREAAVVIDDVQLRDIGLPPELQASIVKVQQELQAGNERQQAIKTAEQEAERARIEAEGAARVSQIKAENAAKVRLIAAEAEASSNERIAKSLTPAVIRLREIEAQRAILESDGTRTIILGGQGSQAPAMMLNMQ